MLYKQRESLRWSPRSCSSSLPPSFPPSHYVIWNRILIIDCFAPFNEPELFARPMRRTFNRLPVPHRYRVVVENSLSAIKPWLIVKHANRGDIEDQVFFHFVTQIIVSSIFSVGVFVYNSFTAYRIYHANPKHVSAWRQISESWVWSVGGWLEEFLWFDVLYPNLY